MRFVGRETALGRGENVERAMLQHRPMASENKIVIPDLEMNVQFDSNGEDAVSLSSIFFYFFRRKGVWLSGAKTKLASVFAQDDQIPST